MPLIIKLEWRWGNVETSSPDLHLVLAMLCHRLQLIQPLQCAIMSFIEPPCFDHRNMVAIHLIGRVVESLNGPG